MHHSTKFGDLHEWEWPLNWVKESSEYTEDYGDKTGKCMNGLLEEPLNFVYHIEKNQKKTNNK